MWLCKCSCDKQTELIVPQHSLKTGNTKSCGCLQKDAALITGKNNKKYNSYDLSGEYGIGRTYNTNNEFYFDLEDYDKIKNYCWYEDKDGYILNKTSDAIIRMHRLILNATDDCMVDHINHCKNDNRKQNIRLCTVKENNINVGLQKNNTSGDTGISYDNFYSCWRASITVDYKKIHLGSFSNREDALKARIKAEEKYFGEYSYRNSMQIANNNTKENV